MRVILFLITVLLLSSCYHEDDYLISKLDENFVKLLFETDTLAADGASSSLIFIEVPYETKDDITKIILRTSNGKFENDKQEIEEIISKVVINGQDKKIAKAKLTSSQKVENATIEAKVADIVKIKEMTFKRAYAEQIKTDIPSLTISYGFQTITLTTKLIRTIGKPSIYSEATIKAVDLQGNTIGQFLNYSKSVNENGILTNQFSLGTTNCNCQKVIIISETKDSDNSYIRDTTSLIIN